MAIGAYTQESMRVRSPVRFLLESLESLVVLPLCVVTWPVTRFLFDTWGAREEEPDLLWPGDRLTSANRRGSTRAIDIDASAEEVWQWVIQIGCGRGGFYSYEWLEHLIGIPVTNVESVEAHLQSLVVGEEILLHPKAPGIPVALVEVGRHLCFGEAPPAERSSPKSSLRRSWSLYTVPTTDDQCRLVVRSCFEQVGRLPLMTRLALAFGGPIDFAMEQRMMRTIKRLAETAPPALVH